MAKLCRRSVGGAVLGALMAALSWTAPASAQDLDVGVDLVSSYVFRGFDQNQGVSLQPYINYEILDGLTASIWASLTLEDPVGIYEVDYQLAYTVLTGGPLSFTGGAVLYDVKGIPETEEIFVGADLDVLLSPYLYLYYDFDAFPGLFYLTGASHSFVMPNRLGTLDLEAALGFQTGRDPEGFNYAALSVGFSRNLGEWTIQPALDMYFPREAVDPSANGFHPVFRFSASRAF